jgi:hypothetical protein
MNGPPQNIDYSDRSYKSRLNFDFNLAAPARGPAADLAYIE